MTNPLRRLCVFTGSREGKNVVYSQSAELMASEMLQRQIDLVYGGGTIGLMGKIAKAIHQGTIYISYAFCNQYLRNVITGGGKVLGVIPKAFITLETHGDLIGEVCIFKEMRNELLQNDFLANRRSL
jgi:predicted Rossmann-fold nucleotide-binding protein